jgi:hypothetical protein
VCANAGDYSAAFYTQLLRGFTDGAQAGDPAVKRLPCALQVTTAPKHRQPCCPLFSFGSKALPLPAPQVNIINRVQANNSGGSKCLQLALLAVRA